MYPNLFSPFRIGKLTLKNRVVMPAMGTGLAKANGELGEELIAYYARRAKGGVGLIIVEVTAIDYVHGKGGPTAPRLDDISFAPGWQRLADRVRPYGAKIFAQLQHPGNQTCRMLNGGNEILSASEVQSFAEPDAPRAMTTEEVKAMVGSFVTGAALAQAAGLDGVEIHGAHGYLINQFISPYTNRRTDEYGGSFENRIRFAKEIILGIRAVCGPDFPISFRITADEFTEYGYGFDTGLEIAKYVSELGVDVLNVSCSTYESTVPSVEPSSFAQGWRTYMAEEIKKVVNVPVITVGVIREPRVAEDIIRTGRADLVAIGRGNMADPDWCNKARYGHEEEICKCIGCLHCLDELFKGHIVTCAVNPEKGREAWLGEPAKDGNGRKVVVVGAGPGGIAASIVLARRGFHAILFEAEDRIGGQLVPAMSTPGKEKIGWYLQYAETMLKKLGVDIRLGESATRQIILDEHPYAVFLATGGTPIVPKLPGIEETNVTTAEAYLTDKVNITNKRVAVIGGGMTGCETAVRLAAEGNQVTIIEMQSDLCVGVVFANKMDTEKKLRDRGVERLLNTKLTAVNEQGITVESLVDGREQFLDVDAVVLALGVKPENSLRAELEDDVERLFVVGDALKSGRIANATHAAHILAAELT